MFTKSHIFFHFLYIFFSLCKSITNTQGVATITYTIADDSSFILNINEDTTTNTIITPGNYIYTPILDGTESWTKISNYTPTFNNNSVCNACGFLTDGWDNTIDWELTFEYYYTANHQYPDHGAIITFNDTNRRDYNSIQLWLDYIFIHNGSGSATLASSIFTADQYNNVKVTKQGSQITIVVNNGSPITTTSTMFTQKSVAVIGLDKTGNNTNSCIRNIRVKGL